MKKLFLAISAICIAVPVFAGEPWAPVSGYSSVNQTKTYNEFVFASLNGQYGDDETYEHETQVYNNAFSDYDGYSRSNMPKWYYDTPFLDVIDNFTIGSAKAADLQDGVRYVTYMRLKKGNNSDCQGCCSHHGGVVCAGGASRCADGTGLSEICFAKGCNQCLNQSIVRIKGQRGHAIIPGCTSTWCIEADATTGTMCLLNAPQYKAWTY
jgi:hypothetical protein